MVSGSFGALTPISQRVRAEKIPLNFLKVFNMKKELNLMTKLFKHFKLISKSLIFSIWLSFFLGGFSSAALADLTTQNEDLILKIKNGGEVVALDKQTLAQKWVFGSDGEILTPPLALPDLILVKTHDGRVYALDPFNGNLRWFYQQTLPTLTLHQDSPPLVTDTRVYVGFADATVVALSRETGALIWTTRIAIPKGDSPMARLVDIIKPLQLEGDTLIAVSYPNHHVYLAAETGKFLS